MYDNSPLRYPRRHTTRCVSCLWYPPGRDKDRGHPLPSQVQDGDYSLPKPGSGQMVLPPLLSGQDQGRGTPFPSHFPLLDQNLHKGVDPTHGTDFAKDYPLTCRRKIQNTKLEADTDQLKSKLQIL